MPDRADAVDDQDGRWIVVDGRRWRATDPSIPEPFRKELVAELLSARRAVGAGHDVPAARARVHDAKVALGERGHPWWLDPTPAQLDERLTAATLALARHRGPDKTICPSDAARAVGGPKWRSQLDAARDAARTLARAGEVVILQRGEPVDLDADWHGPVRIRVPRSAGG